MITKILERCKHHSGLFTDKNETNKQLTTAINTCIDKINEIIYELNNNKNM